MTPPRILLGASALIALAGCAQVSTLNSKIVADLPTAQQAAQAAITLYGIDKGIALVAAAADPALAPFIDSVIAITDPLVATAQLAVNDASADAAQVTGLADRINAQAAQLALTGAPVIKVVPATTN